MCTMLGPLQICSTAFKAIDSHKLMQQDTAVMDDDIKGLSQINQSISRRRYSATILAANGNAYNALTEDRKSFRELILKEGMLALGHLVKNSDSVTEQNLPTLAYITHFLETTLKTAQNALGAKTELLESKLSALRQAPKVETVKQEVLKMLQNADPHTYTLVRADDDVEADGYACRMLLGVYRVRIFKPEMNQRDNRDEHRYKNPQDYGNCFDFYFRPDISSTGDYKFDIARKGIVIKYETILNLLGNNTASKFRNAVDSILKIKLTDSDISPINLMERIITLAIKHESVATVEQQFRPSHIY